MLVLVTLARHYTEYKYMKVTDHNVMFFWTCSECMHLLTYVFKVVILGDTCSPNLQHVLTTHLSQYPEDP